MAIPYSAEKDDLYYPARHAVFFPNGRPQSGAALCVELARLAYCRLETSFAFDQDRIRKILGRIQFTDCKFFETATLPGGGGSHAFLALDGKNKLAVLAFRGTDKDDPTDLSDDFNAWPQPWPAGGNVHSGFAKALLDVWQAVDAALQLLSDYELLFAGHSLGAAMPPCPQVCECRSRSIRSARRGRETRASSFGSKGWTIIATSTVAISWLDCRPK